MTATNVCIQLCPPVWVENGRGVALLQPVCSTHVCTVVNSPRGAGLDWWLTPSPHCWWCGSKCFRANTRGATSRRGGAPTTASSTAAAAAVSMTPAPNPRVSAPTSAWRTGAVADARCVMTMLILFLQWIRRCDCE